MEKRPSETKNLVFARKNCKKSCSRKPILLHFINLSTFFSQQFTCTFIFIKPIPGRLFQTFERQGGGASWPATEKPL